MTCSNLVALLSKQCQTLSTATLGPSSQYSKSSEETLVRESWIFLREQHLASQGWDVFRERSIYHDGQKRLVPYPTDPCSLCSPVRYLHYRREITWQLMGSSIGLKDKLVFILLLIKCDMTNPLLSRTWLMRFTLLMQSFIRSGQIHWAPIMGQVRLHPSNPSQQREIISPSGSWVPVEQRELFGFQAHS